MVSKRRSKIGVVGFSQKVFIFGNNGKFLTIRRTKTAPSNPLKWDLPGGDVEFGENPLKSIIRETKEETGYVIKSPVPFDVEAHINTLGDYWVTVAYKAFIASGKLSISWEHDLYRWVTANEFLKLRIPKKLRMFATTLKKQKHN